MDDANRLVSTCTHMYDLRDLDDPHEGLLRLVAVSDKM